MGDQNQRKMQLTPEGCQACVDAIMGGSFLSDEERQSISAAAGELTGEAEWILLAGVRRWFRAHPYKELTRDEKGFALLMALFKLALEAAVRRRAV